VTSPTVAALTGEARTLLAVLFTQGDVGLAVAATAFSPAACDELVAAGLAQAITDGRVYITEDGLRAALGHH
jgi:hypothetical protein